MIGYVNCLNFARKLNGKFLRNMLLLHLIRFNDVTHMNVSLVSLTLDQRCNNPFV